MINQCEGTPKSRVGLNYHTVFSGNFFCMKFFDLRIKTRKCSNSFLNNLQIKFNGNALRTTLKVLALNVYALSFLKWKKKLQVFRIFYLFS
jgi:hypothetical protein